MVRKKRYAKKQNLIQLVEEYELQELHRKVLSSFSDDELQDGNVAIEPNIKIVGQIPLDKLNKVNAGEPLPKTKDTMFQMYRMLSLQKVLG